GTSGHEVIFATSKAQGVTRDAVTGKINGGTITSDAFVQAGGSSWNPTYGGTEAWDSFIASGNRKQNAKITNRAGTLIDYKSSTWGTSTTFGGGQMNTANSNYIENGGGSGWLNTLGAFAYLSGTSAVTSENPFARVSLYSNEWAAVYNYTDLDKSGNINKLKGRLQTGRTAVSGDPNLTGLPGDPLDTTGNYLWMIGRFTIETTGDATPVTMQVQFNMVGRNGTSNDAGTIFTGASTASYKVSQFFSFSVPTPGAAALLGAAGLLGRRRKA
ncbi:MAG: hypothetical protein EBU07_16390, partial [Betaproteobacteria bacterium]|nr:hypothetical protein [Betaproteobacteria bacterium]